MGTYFSKFWIRVHPGAQTSPIITPLETLTVKQLETLGKKFTRAENRLERLEAERLGNIGKIKKTAWKHWEDKEIALKTCNPLCLLQRQNSLIRKVASAGSESENPLGSILVCFLERLHIPASIPLMWQLRLFGKTTGLYWIETLIRLARS